ncbi:PREDICTED: gap junction beta-1 protein-like [Nanorana parkeri]|uniref:gap junction beta-1 protein-like n=1 Tax=Nanorana parkeri TaxID=125878 RepID=UPI0008550273|nr:PREDICTED: gap junction beta-1 protein-like [Nanorana parkeri]
MAMSAEAYQELETATCLLSGSSSLASRLGRVCLAVLFCARFGILIVGYRTVWEEEEKNFHCNTSNLLCRPICFDEFSPISSFNIFSLHLVVLLTHSMCVIYFSSSAYQVKEGWLHSQLRRKSVQTKLHIIVLISRILIEGLFIFTFYKVTDGFAHRRTTRCETTLCEPFVICTDLNAFLKNILSLCHCAASAASAMICFKELLTCLPAVQNVKRPLAGQSQTKKLHF